jgi:hypothetical protein
VFADNSDKVWRLDNDDEEEEVEEEDVYQS